MAIERQLLVEELARNDMTAERIEVGGVTYRQALTSSETYLSAAGPITVTRNLYRPSGRGSRSICPLELRDGVVRGYWTPRAARQGAFAVVHLTPGDSEALFDELGNMRPSRSSLDRLPKALSAHWETHRQEGEATLRVQERVPKEASVIAISVDGVTVRMKGGNRSVKREQPGKHTSGPTGQREAGCGTVVLYDAEGERLQTVRYGRMPERRKATLQQQLEAEAVGVLAVQPDLKRVLLADAAGWIQRITTTNFSHVTQIVDWFHAAERLWTVGKACFNEKSQRESWVQARLDHLWAGEVDKVVTSLTLLDLSQRTDDEELQQSDGYFQRQQDRMRYHQYRVAGYPIGSGTVESGINIVVHHHLKRQGRG